MISANTGHMTLAGGERRGPVRNFLWQSDEIWGESFVHEQRRGRSRPPGQRSRR